MKVLLLATAFPPGVSAGGPSVSLWNLATRHADNDEITVVTPDRDFGSDSPYAELSGKRYVRGNLTVYYVNFKSVRHVVSLWRRLGRQHFDLVVVNSIWDRPLSLVPATLLRLGLLSAEMTVLTPRGELDPGAFSLKSLRKGTLGRVFIWNAGSAADLIAATSETEARECRKRFRNREVVLSTNIADALRFSPLEPIDGGPIRALFVGRIHPQKRLHLAIEALGMCHSDVTLGVYGPAEDLTYWERCQELIADLPSHVAVHYEGPVGRADVERLYAEHDLLLVPTAGENFGHTIAESLQVGCPVVVADTTPWSTAIRATGGGFVLSAEARPSECASALDTWAESSRAEKIEMRKRALSAYREFDSAAPPDVIEAALEWCDRDALRKSRSSNAAVGDLPDKQREEGVA